MASRKYTLDTNVYIRSFRDDVALDLVGRFHVSMAPFEHLSAVVIHELRAGASGPASRRALDRHLIEPFLKRGRVFAPSASAWSRAGDVLSELRLKEGFETRRLGRAFSNDVLLAASCREAGVTLITENTSDFDRIARYCPFEFRGPPQL